MLPDSLGQTALDYKNAQDASMSEMAPRATRMFTKGALDKLVKAFNRLAPAFGLQETYPAIGSDLKVLPTDFVKQLVMVGSATREAIAQDAIDQDLLVSLDGIVNDNGILMLASKLDGLSRSRPFKMWLTEAPDQTESEPMESESEPVADSEPDLMGMLKSRMGPSGA